MCTKGLLSTSEMFPGSFQGKHIPFHLFNKYLECLPPVPAAQGVRQTPLGRVEKCLPWWTWHPAVEHTPRLTQKCGFLEKQSSIRPKMVVSNHRNFQNSRRGGPTPDAGLHTSANTLVPSGTATAPNFPQPPNPRSQTIPPNTPKLTQSIVLWVTGRETKSLSNP